MCEIYGSNRSHHLVLQSMQKSLNLFSKNNVVFWIMTPPVIHTLSVSPRFICSSGALSW